MVLDREEFLEYLKNHTRKEAAKHFKVKIYVIDKNIKLHGYKKESAVEKLRNFQEILPKEKLEELYVTQKKSYQEISETYHIPGGYLDSLLKAYRLGKRSTTTRILEDYTKEELEDMYFKQNLTIKEMSIRLGTKYLNIRKAFKKLGIGKKDKKLVQQNIEKTFLSKYGTKNVRQSEYYKQKSAETKFERYGDPKYNNIEQINKTIANRQRMYRSTDSGPNREFVEVMEKYNIKFSREFALSNRRYDFKVGNTLIEINPYATHNSTWGPYGTEAKSSKYHVEKTMLARENGYHCIHVWDWDNLDKVVKLVLPKTQIYARKCTIKEISQYEANKFLNTYHLQKGAKLQTVCIALFFEDEIVQVMTFGKPRFNKKYQWELIRLCTKAGKLVVGGSERMFKFFLKNYDVQSIISYCDMSKFRGNVYLNLGFKLLSTNNPSRHWYDPKSKRQLTDNGVRMIGYDKLVGQALGKVYGKGTSNEALLKEHGWVEIWDAGQAVFEYIRTTGIS